MIEQQIEKKRYHLLDTIRGVMIIGVVVFHTILDLTEFGLDLEFLSPNNSLWVRIIQVIGLILLISISGISCHFSRNNVKRALICIAAAAGISIFTYFFTPEFFIYLGILHMFSMFMLLYAIFDPLVRKFIHPTQKQCERIAIIGSVICVVLFFLTLNIWSKYYGIGVFGWHLPLTDCKLYGTFGGYILGFAGFSPASADYFPLMPWIFIFLAGIFIGYFFEVDKVPKAFSTDYCPLVTKIGKKTLLIYVLHQPALYAILLGVFWIIGLFG